MSARVAMVVGGAVVPQVVLVAPGGALHTLGIGDLIGRLPTAALAIDDPRISEAHAMISLRGGGLHLLSLRRMVVVGGRPVTDVRLVPGLVVELAAKLTLVIVEVHTPADVLAIELPEHGPQILPQVASVVGEPPRLVARFIPDAPLTMWATGPHWRVRAHGGATGPLHAGDVLEVGGHRLRVRTLPLGAAEPARTTSSGGVLDPIQLIAHYDVVEIRRHHRAPLVLGGIGAQLVSELVACAGPVHWQTLARILWPGDAHDPDLRHRWDVALNRLRTRLREAGIRGDLLCADRSGQLVLVLYDGDQVDDQT